MAKTNAQKAYEKGKKARANANKKGIVTTQPKQKKKQSKPKEQPKQQKSQPKPQAAKPKVSSAIPTTVKPKTPTLPTVTNPTQQYQDYQKSKYVPKITNTSKPSNLESAQKAFDTYQQRKDEQKKNKVVGTEAKKPKDNIISDFSKPKDYDYKKDLEKAKKIGDETTYLGTKQKDVTVDLATKKQRKKQTEAQQKQYYKSDDWKETKAKLKQANQKQWRDYLRKELGWSKDRINEWMESEEGMQHRKDTYTEMKESVKTDINKSIKKGVDKATTLKSVDALTRGEFDKMVTASRLGKDLGNKYLDNIDPDLAEKIGSKTIESGLRSKGAYGVMQGMSKADIFTGGVGRYNEAAKTGMEQIKNSGAYNIGYGVGMAADMMMGGVASRGASLATGSAKALGKLTGKEIAENLGESWGKRFATNRVGELMAETPTNILDAAKMSMDADGKVNKDELKKWLLINSGLTFGVGGAIEGVGALATRKLANETVDLLAKKEAQNLTKAEADQLEANLEKLTKKSGNNAISGDFADRTLQESRRVDNQLQYMQAGKGKGTPNTPNATKGSGEFYTRGGRQKVKDVSDANQAKIAETKKAKREAEIENARKTYDVDYLEKENVNINREIRKTERQIKKLKGQAKSDNTLAGHEKIGAKQRELEAKKKELQNALSENEGKLKNIDYDRTKRASTPELSNRLKQVLKEKKSAKTHEEYQRLVNEETAIKEQLKEHRELRQLALKTEKLYAKQVAGTISEDEAKQLEKNMRKLKSKNMDKELREIEANNKLKTPEERIKEIDDELQDIHDRQMATKDGDVVRDLNAEARALNEEKAKLLKQKKETPKPKNEPADGEHYAMVGEEDAPEFLREKPTKAEKPNIRKDHAYEDFQAHNNAKTPRSETPEAKRAEKKAKKEAGKFKSFWRAFYNSFVSELAPYERMAMSASTREERKLGRVAINKMLVARSKALEKIRSEGDIIFTKRGLEKDAKKAEAYDTYTLLKHDLDRLKQKMISVKDADDKMHHIYFNDLSEKERAFWNKKTGKEWNYDNMSNQEIIDFCNKADLDTPAVIKDKSFSGLDAEQIGDVLADLESKYGKDIKDFQKEITDYHKDLLNLDAEAGIISKEEAEKLTKRYENYVPAYREGDIDVIVQDLPSQHINVARLYEANGSENMEGILPLYTQMVAKTNMVMKRAAENEMLNVIAKINNMEVKDLPKGHAPEELLEVTSGVYRTDNGKHMIFFKENGKGRSMEISEEAYHAMRQWSGAEKAAIMEYKFFQKTLDNPHLQKAAQAFKAFITDYSIIFGARNFVRDTATALVYSEKPTQWLRSFPKAVMAITNPNSQYAKALKQYIKDGGRYNTLVTSTDLNKVIKAGKKDGIPGLRIIKNVNTALETLPRMSEYIATVERLAKKEGKSFDEALASKNIVDEAMYNAKEVTLNFDRAGQYGRILNRGFVPFFNPSIQGIDKLVRVLYSDNKSMREFMEMGAKMSGMVVMPAIAWEMFVGKNEEYQKLSSYNKYTYFCIPWKKDDDGDQLFIKIPRAREMSAMQIPIDWFIQNVKYGTRDGEANLFMSAKRAFKLGFEQIGPVNPLSDNFISPMINLARNKDWMGYNVEGREDQDKRKLGNVNDIYDADTSTAAVTIQHMINNGMTKGLKALGISDDAMQWVKKHQMSPKQLDQIFDSYMGVLYDMGMRPFSQRGASLKEVASDPGDAVKQWASSTFGTAFVVNGTLSSSRRTEMYAKLDSLYGKLDGYKKGTDEYNDVQSQITKLKNNVTYDVTTLDSAIDKINRNKNLTMQQKAALTTAIKREQNAIIDDFNDGKNKVHDPLEYLLNMKDKNGKKVFTTEQVIKNFTYTNDDGNNTIKDSWNYMKESDYYKKHPKKAERDFIALTLETRKVAGKCNESKSFMDYTTMAVVSESHKAESGKDYQHILDAYGVGKGQVKMADVYVNQMGGNTKTYTASHRHIVEGAEELGVYTSKLKDHDYAMILANARTKNGNKLKDRAYFIEDINSWGTSSWAYERMNPARCLSDEKYEKSNWSYKKVHNFAKANNLSYKSADDTIVNAINKKYPNKTNEEKAALFGVIKPTDDNPFGEIGDYSVKGDSGYDPSSGKGGHGRRGWGHRGHGGGGGGGKSSFTPVINTAGKNAKITDTTKKSHTSKSNLDDAYRKKVKKLREGMRK